jgi:UDP-glucose 4-epimerase
MRILLTGGAGYIGSHIGLSLLAEGHQIITVDNLSKGHRAAVQGGGFYQVDLANRDALQAIFAKERIDGVIHLAADSLVGESVQKPVKYYRNNLANGLTLLEVMIEAGVKNIVFSSTAAVYGEPEGVPIGEAHPKNPTNPYGQSKLYFEGLLEWLDKANGLKFVSLRYFNAAGADPSGKIGEDHQPESHLLPLIMQVPLGVRAELEIYGDDYPTPDGTCVRDYIHVNDLAQAHILALK